MGNKYIISRINNSHIKENNHRNIHLPPSSFPIPIAPVGNSSTTRMATGRICIYTLPDSHQAVVTTTLGIYISITGCFATAVRPT